MTDKGSGLAEEILELAKELDALLYGEFVLTSGQTSKYYFDGRLLTLSPRGANLVARALLPAIRTAGASAVGGPAVAAVPMVTEIAMLSGQDGGEPVPGFFVRKEAKDYGMGKAVDRFARIRTAAAQQDGRQQDQGNQWHETAPGRVAAAGSPPPATRDGGSRRGTVVSSGAVRICRISERLRSTCSCFFTMATSTYLLMAIQI